MDLDTRRAAQPALTDMAGKQPGFSRKAVAGWLLFDWAAQPVHTLVTTFVFAPYFASTLAPTPAAGQALWGYATAAAGLTIALLAPLLGSIADRTGARKRWVCAFSVPLVLGCLLLWFAVPGGQHAVPIALFGFVLATIGVEFATVFNNAMMSDLVPSSRLGRLSGSGWALGYVGGLVSLVIALGLMAANPETGNTLFGLEPILDLDPTTRDGDRASGPFSALWYIIFVLPLFLFTPDTPRGTPLQLAVASGLVDLAAALGKLRRDAAMLIFLVANMIYKDGLVALFAFGGIYAAGVLDWGSIEIGTFGILLTVTGTAGAALGGWLDDRFGPRPVIAGALILLIVCGLGLVSVDKSSVFFVVDVASSAGGGPFSTLPERVFLVLGGVIGGAAGPLQSASRTLLVRLAPPAELTSHFGLFALSGKLTSFLAPMAVGIVTDVTSSQKAGISVILIFFSAGLLLLLQMRSPRA